MRRLGARVRSEKRLTRLVIDTTGASLGTGEIEDWFETADGHKLPVFADHRSALKSWWRVHRPVASLEAAQAVLEPSEDSFLRSGIGRRTLEAPLDEFSNLLRRVAARHPDLFIESGSEFRWLPSAEEVEAAVRANLGRIVNQLADAGLGPGAVRGREVLDVGCGEAGFALPTYERLGARHVVGIDNEYGSIGSTRYADAVRARMATRSEVVQGDMVDGSELLGSERFDLVASTSVLEHVADLPAFFRGSFAVVKPGGICIHRYEPYFSLRGGHALGIMDQPWGHLVMADEERDAYVDRFRPYEAEAIRSWFGSALNFATVREIIDAATGAGFELVRVVTAAESEWSGTEHDLPLVLAALQRHPGIGFADPFTRAVTVVLRRM
jgi:SAM-dependent methyltransferase